MATKKKSPKKKAVSRRKPAAQPALPPQSPPDAVSLLAPDAAPEAGTLSGMYFVLITPPAGNPPQMRMRDFRSSAGSACAAPVRIVDAVAYRETDQECDDGPVCRAL